MKDIRKDIGHKRKRKRKGPFKVAVLLLTLWSFLFSAIGGNILIENAWATKGSLGSTNVFLNRTGSPGVFKELNPETFQLPEYLGSIRAAHTANLDKTVIHIQDAHCNYYAQHKINDIIGYLNKEYGINSVNLEGGKGEYDLSIFTRIREKDIREKVADYFVKEGIVNGAEYFAINNPDKLNLWGIEDTKLYLENLNLYRDTLKHKETIDKHLKALKHIFSNLKLHIFPKELLEFDKKYNQYKANSLELKSYLIHLAETAKEKEIDIADFTNFSLLRKSLTHEDTIDFRSANAERNALIDKFQKMLSKKSLEELTRKAVEFKTEKLSQHAFYSYLFEKARIINLDLTPYPELKKYTSYISTYDAIDKFEIMKEVDELDTKIRETLYENDTQRELTLLCKNLALMENMLNLALTKEDYEYYTKNKDSFNIQNFISFIEKQAPLYKITARPDENVTKLNIHIENMAKCYGCTFKRDQAFIKNLNLKNTAIVITGGFHSENLQDLCKKRNISYISVMPNFKTRDGYECPYSGLLAGNTNGIQQKLYPIISSVSSLQIYSMLTGEIESNVWGRANVDAFRAAVLVQEQIARGRDITNIKRDGNDVIFYMADGTEERIPIRALLDAVHQKDIDGQMEKLSENAFEDVNDIDSLVDEIKEFLKSIGANQEILDRVEALKGRNIDGRALVRLVRGVTFRGHAGGQGIRINADNKGDKLKGVLVHEIIAGLFGDHFLAERIEQTFLASKTGEPLLAEVTPLEMGIWSMLPEQRLEVDRDFAQKGIFFEGGSREFKLLLAAWLHSQGSVNTVKAILSSEGQVMSNETLVDTILSKLRRISNGDELVWVVNRYATESDTVENDLSEVVDLARDPEYGGRDRSDTMQDVLSLLKTSGDEETIDVEFSKPEEQEATAMPEQPQGRKAGVNQKIAQRRVTELEKAKQRIEANDLPDVLNFGDQHGEAAELRKILNAARQAANNGRRLAIIGHGDAFDRGHQNIENFRILKELKRIADENANVSVHLLLGNHDAMLIQGVLLGDRDAMGMWLTNGGMDFAEELGIQVRNEHDVINNPQIREIALWLLQNLELFHVDERGFLHAHAGIPADENGNPLINQEQLGALRHELDAIQQKVRANSRFVDNIDGQRRIANFFAASDGNPAHAMLWVRQGDWINRFREGRRVNIEGDPDRLIAAIREENKQLSDVQIRNLIENELAHNDKFRVLCEAQFGIKVRVEEGHVNQNRLDNFLAQLGVQGIIFGHIHEQALLNLDNRIFCIDVNEGDPGHLIFNGEGIKFNAAMRAEDIVATRGEILAKIDEELARLKDLLGEDTRKVETEKAEHLMQAETETVTVKQRAVARQEQASYPKALMRRLKQQLQFAWANGVMGFMARESTQLPGALRIWNINIGIPVGAVYHRDTQGRLLKGDSFLIEEGETFSMGRDRSAGTPYTFAVVDRAFDVIPVNRTQFESGEVSPVASIDKNTIFILVERETPINIDAFKVSRTLHNTPTDAFVTINEEATSETQVKPVIVVSNREEALQVLQEIVNMMELGLRDRHHEDDLAWSGRVTKEQAMAIIKEAMKKGVGRKIRLPGVVENTIESVIGPEHVFLSNTDDSVGMQRRYTRPEIRVVPDSVMQGIEGPIRGLYGTLQFYKPIKQELPRQVIVVGESEWRRINDAYDVTNAAARRAHIEVILKLAHEYMAGFIAFRNSLNKDNRIDGDEAHSLSRQIEHILLTNIAHETITGIPILKGDLQSEHHDINDFKVISAMLERALTLEAMLAMRIDVYNKLDALEKLQKKELDKRRMERGEDLSPGFEFISENQEFFTGEARMYRASEIPAMREAANAEWTLGKQLNYTVGEINKINAQLAELGVGARLLNEEVEDTEVEYTVKRNGTEKKKKGNLRAVLSITLDALSDVLQRIGFNGLGLVGEARETLFREGGLMLVHGGEKPSLEETDEEYDSINATDTPLALDSGSYDTLAQALEKRVIDDQGYAKRHEDEDYSYGAMHMAEPTQADLARQLDELMSQIQSGWTRLSTDEADRLLSQADAMLHRLGNPEYVEITPFYGGTVRAGFRKNIADRREVLQKESALREISARNNRPFIPSGDWLAPNLEESNDRPDLFGHVTSFDNLYGIIFENEGILRGSMSAPIFVNQDGHGQAARVRLNHNAGIVPVVLDNNQLLNARPPIELSNLPGEATFVTDVPVKFATKNSKAFMWQAILTEIEFRREALTDGKKLQLAQALGYRNYEQLEQELSELARSLAAEYAAQLPERRPGRDEPIVGAMHIVEPKEADLETRQANTVESLLSNERKTDVVKTVVGIPSNMNRAKVQQTLRKINRGLARNGFGKRDDTHQATTFEIDISDPEKTRQNYEKAMENARRGLPAKGRIVLFAPQMDRGPQLAGQAQAQYKGETDITVIPDTYSDAQPDQDKYPDLNIRTALARHVAFYYNGNDRKSALDSINTLLRHVSENAVISSIEQLLNILSPLRIRPVIFESLKHWQESQEATATAL